MDIYDKDDNNILSKSLTGIIEKANETIAGLKCASMLRSKTLMVRHARIDWGE